MKKTNTRIVEDIRAIYLEASNRVADEYYPKGQSDRRGEYLRDQAELLRHAMPGLVKLVEDAQEGQRVDIMAQDSIIGDIDRADTGRSLADLQKQIAANWWFVDDVELAAAWMRAMSFVSESVGIYHTEDNAAGCAVAVETTENALNWVSISEGVCTVLLQSKANKFEAVTSNTMEGYTFHRYVGVPDYAR